MSENNDTFINEKQLWHGTSPETVEKICKQGFDWRMVKTHAYGKGSYFARDASYSNGYSECNDQGVSFMFFADVLAGYGVRVRMPFFCHLRISL